MEGCGEGPPEIRDLETKLGRKTPEWLLRWMKEEPGGEAGGPGVTLIPSPGLGDKIRRLRLELSCLRAIDVQILQQLLLVNEGIESVKWLLEDRGPLTSRCSSLTSSQYSLAGSQGASRRGSWSSQPDANDRLDSISIGSFLDTLADDLDEYSLSCSEPALPPSRHHSAPGPTLPASLHHSAPGPALPTTMQPSAPGTPLQHSAPALPSIPHHSAPGPALPSSPHHSAPGTALPTTMQHSAPGPPLSSSPRHSAPGPALPSSPHHSAPGAPLKHYAPGPTLPSSPHHSAPGPTLPSSPRHSAALPVTGQDAEHHRGGKGKAPRLPAPAGKTPNGPLKPVPGEEKHEASLQQNGRPESDKHKLTNQTQLEYEAHWRWVQSQDDVTFL